MERSEKDVYVSDASTAVKWFVSEPDSDKSRMLKEAYAKGTIDLVAPRLLEYETLNALRFHPIVKLTGEQIVSALTMLRQLEIMIEPSMTAWQKAVGMALSLEISIYDAVYLGLAEAFGARLVTSDRRLMEKLSETERRNLVLLKELRL